jgi:hypothetical protein
MIVVLTLLICVAAPIGIVAHYKDEAMSLLGRGKSPGDELGAISAEFKKKMRKNFLTSIGASVLGLVGGLIMHTPKDSEEFWVGLLCLFFFGGGGIFLLMMALRSMSSTGGKYIPLQSCKRWRKSPEDLLKLYKKMSVLGSVAIAAVFIMIFAVSGTFYINGVIMVISAFCICKFFERRVRFSVPLDDASLFELESLGVVSVNDVVLSLYKDFSSWNDVKAGSKILLITQDNFIVINFTGRDAAKKISFRLASLERLSIMTSDKEGTDANVDFLITMGFKDSDDLKLVLKGESYQDSPELFIAAFLKEADARLLKKPRPPRAGRPAADVKPGEGFREIAIEDADTHRTGRVIEL